MVIFAMIGALSVLAFLSMAGSIASYGRRRPF